MFIAELMFVILLVRSFIYKQLAFLVATTLSNPLKESAFRNILVLDLGCGQKIKKAPRHEHFANVKRPAASLKFWKLKKETRKKRIE